MQSRSNTSVFSKHLIWSEPVYRCQSSSDKHWHTTN